MGLKICFLASTYPRFSGDGGAGRSIKSIAQALVDQGHEVHVLAPYHPKMQSVSGPIKVHPFRYIWPDRWAIMGYAGAMQSDRKLRDLAYLLAPLFFLSGLWKLLRLTAKYQFDVIHAHWVIPNGPIGLLVAKAFRLPLFISLHGSDVFVARQNLLFGAIARFCFRYAQAVTACSKQLQSGALALDSIPSRTQLILWGADPAIFDKTTSEDVEQLRAQLGIAEDAPIIMSLARLVEKKGLAYLVEATRYVRERYPNVQVIIAGEGPEKRPLEQLAASLNLVDSFHFVGNVPWHEVPTYFHLCDMFVVPSIEDENGNLDGLPATILEAMAAGKPVVASRVAGIPLVVKEKETGSLVEERQTDELAQAILLLLDDSEQRRTMGWLARQRVEEYLNWDRVARDFVSLYQGALPPDQDTSYAQAKR